MERKHGPIYHFPSADDAFPITIAFIGINHCLADYVNIRTYARITVIGYVLSGQGTITLNDRTVHPKKGNVFLLPTGYYHQVAADPDSPEQWSYIWFNIHGDLAVRLLEAYGLLESGFITCPSAERLFQRAIHMAQCESAQAMLQELPILFHQIVLHLSNIQNKRGTPYTDEVQTIKDFLDHSVQGVFDSSLLCKSIGLSMKQINRLFKKEVGTTVYSYVLAKKMDSAKMMLLDTDLTINEICYELGFSDPHYFSNLFKKKSGASPRLFRIRHR